MNSDKKYYEEHFKPKFSVENDNKIKISWAHFCIPTKAEISQKEDGVWGDPLPCSETESGCIIELDSCKHYEFLFEVKSAVLGKMLPVVFPYATRPSDI